MEATNTSIVAAEQTNAAFREAVERRAQLQAPPCGQDGDLHTTAAPRQDAARPVGSTPTPGAIPALLPLCRHCDEPIPLMRLSTPYRDDLCDECDSDEQERMSQEYEAERAADAPYHGRR